MKTYKGRAIVPGQKVEVYRNLNVSGHYSVRDAKSKLVLGHAESVLLKNCRYVVSKKGRENVNKTKRRTVHAHVVGELISINIEQPETIQKIVYYNPYKTESFVLLSDIESVVECSNFCYAKGKYVYI